MLPDGRVSPVSSHDNTPNFCVPPSSNSSVPGSATLSPYKAPQTSIMNNRVKMFCVEALKVGFSWM